MKNYFKIINMKKFIAIDFGEKRTGIALSDDAGMIYPYKVIDSKNLIKELKEILKKENYDGIVVGNPMVGKRKKKIEEIIKLIMANFNIEIIEWDESCTTKRAESYLIEIGEKPSKNKGRIDEIAACFILQEFLFGN